MLHPQKPQTVGVVLQNIFLNRLVKNLAYIQDDSGKYRH